MLQVHCEDNPFLSPVLEHYVFMLHNEEMFVRQAACHGLEVFVGHAFRLLRSPQKNKTVWGNIVDVLTGVLLPSLHESLRSESPAVRKGVLGIIACVVKHGHHAYAENEPWIKFCSLEDAQASAKLHVDLSPMLNEKDREQDLFANLRHIQVHRIVRAVRGLRTMLEEGELDLSEHTCQSVVLPIALHFVVESSDQKASLLKEEAVSLVATVAGRMSWQHYWPLLRSTIRKIKVC